MPEGYPSRRDLLRSPTSPNERWPPAEEDELIPSSTGMVLDSPTNAKLALEERRKAKLALRRAVLKERSSAALSTLPPVSDEDTDEERLRRRHRRREKHIEKQKARSLSGAAHVVRMSRRMKDRVDDGDAELSEWSSSDESVDELLAIWHRPDAEAAATATGSSSPPPPEPPPAAPLSKFERFRRKSVDLTQELPVPEEEEASSTGMVLDSPEERRKAKLSLRRAVVKERTSAASSAGEVLGLLSKFSRGQPASHSPPLV